jgi:MFS family permease
MTETLTPEVAYEAVGGARELLRNRSFFYLWMAQLFCQTAEQSLNFGIMLIVEERTHSAGQMSLAVLSYTIPTVLLGFVSGVLTDRWNKKTVMWVTNAIRVGIALLYIAVLPSLAMIYVITFAIACVWQFFGPAEATAIPILVKRNQLLTANAFFNFTFFGSQVVGFLLVAPGLVKIFGFGYEGLTAIFIFLAVMFAIATFWGLLLPGDKLKAVGHEDSPGLSLRTIWAELVDGWRLVFTNRYITFFTATLVLSEALTLLIVALVPRYVVGVLGIQTADVPYVLAPAGIGLIGGAVVMPALGRRWKKEHLVTVGLFLIGGSLVFLGLLPRLYVILMSGQFELAVRPPMSNILPLVMAVAPIAGFGFTLLLVPSQTILQEIIPIEYRGRAFATQLKLARIASTAPLVVLPPLADLIGVNKIAVLGALSVLAIAFVSVRLTRGGIPVPVEEQSLA